MPLDFPSSPTVGQQYLNWTWNGVAWVVVPGPPLASLAQSAQNAGRNFIDNALFNIQQRGIGPWTANGSYTADRWLTIFSGDVNSFALAQISDAQRTQIGDESAIWALQNNFTGSAGAGAFSSCGERIEKVHRLAGKTITVSFFATSPTNLLLGVSYDQIFGTGGSPSATVSGNGQSVTTSSVFARYQVTLNIPSAVGKTFGTNGDDFTSINFWYSSGSTNAARAGNIGVQSGIIAIWGVQVEVGSQATPLEKLVPEVDLARCQRFYQVAQLFSIQTYGETGSGVGNNWTFATQMRAAASITFGTPLTSSNVTGPPSVNAQTSSGCNLIAGVVSNTGTAYSVVPVTASADL